MPNPSVGSGADVSKGLQISQYALYLAASTDGGAVVPANKIGAGSNPTGTWARQGRLREDGFQAQIGDPEIFAARAGWNRSVKWKAVRQAEDVVFILRLDERDPDVQAKLRGTTATSLSNGSNVGQAYTYKTGASYGAKMLLVGVSANPNSTREHHIFAASCVVTFKMVKEDDYEGMEVRIEVSDVSSSETFQDREWD